MAGLNRSGWWRGLTMRGWWSAVWFGGLLMAAACSKEDEGGPDDTGPKAGFEVVEEGAGPTNEEPLWPMRVGARWDFRWDNDLNNPNVFINRGSVGITRVTDKFGKAWLLQQTAGPECPKDMWVQGLGWNQGKNEAYWSMDPEGLVLRAVQTNEALETPLLVIPATVKRGMKWQVKDADGNVALDGEISGGDMKETAWGRRRVWAVHVEVPEANRTDVSVMTSDSKNLPTVWEQEFVEGRGPSNAYQAIVPLEDQEYDLPQRLAMQPLPELTKEFKGRVEGFSVTQDAATGHFEAQLGMRVPAVVPKQFITLGGSVTEYFPDRRICYRTDGQSVVEILPDVWEQDPPLEWNDGPCQDANGVLYDADGEVAVHVPFLKDGRAPGNWFYDFGPGIQIMGYNSIGTFMSSDPVWGPTGLVRDKGILAGGMAVILPDSYWEFEPYRWPYWEQLQNPNLKMNSWWFGLGPWTQQWDMEHVDRSVALTPEDEQGLEALFLGRGLLGHAQLGPSHRPQMSGQTGIWRARESGLDLHTYDEFVVVTKIDNTRDVYQVSEDGYIWRLEMLGGVLTRSLLAAVQVPQDQQVIGVVPISDQQLQVWTQDGFVWEGWTDVAGVGAVDIYVNDIRQHVWNVQIPQPGPAQPPPMGPELFMQASGRDLLICAPNGNVLPTEGWTLGGLEPTVLSVDERCILLVRPLAHYSSPLPTPEEAQVIPLDPASWLVTGELPDLGTVALMLTPEQPLIPTDLRASGDGTLVGGRQGDSWDQEIGLVRLWGAGKAIIEHFWAPIETSVCSKYVWELQVWSGSTVPPECGDVGTCWTVVRIGEEVGDWEVFALSEAGQVNPPSGNPLENGVLTLPDGCPGLLWSGWYFFLDDELGPVEIARPFGVPTEDEALCTMEHLDLNDGQPDMDRYTCQMASGETHVVDLPSRAEQRFTRLDSISTVYYTSFTPQPQLWRMELGEMVPRPVTVPRGDHFGGREIADIDGYCGLDGVCYMLLVGVAEGQSGAIPWEIVRVDQEVSGLHPVYSAWASAEHVPQEIIGDEQLLIITGSNQILWRGFRTMEPAECPDCSLQEGCLSGYCECPFGSVRLDGYCEADLASEVYVSCAAALEAPAGNTAPPAIRIDGDGPDFPSPQFATQCEAGSEWTEPPLDWLLDSAVGSMGMHNTCNIPGGYGFDWASPVTLLGFSSAFGLHGEFEVELNLGQPQELSEETYQKRTVFVLDGVDQFDTQTGRYVKACGLQDWGAEGLELRLSYYGADTLEVDGPGYQGDATVQWFAGDMMTISRQADGFIRIKDGETVVWSTFEALPNDLRIYKLDGGMVDLKSVRWKGSSGLFCVPKCDGKVCGDDHCGGVCGTCQENAHCDGAQQCVCDDPYVAQYMTQVCIFPWGTEAHPAESCQQAAETGGEWSTQAWIDPDGVGGEAPFQMSECAYYSPDNPNWTPWTIAPAYFLGDTAVVVYDTGAGTCGAFADHVPPFNSPISSSGSSGHLLGLAAPAGTRVAATGRFVRGQFSINSSLALGGQGQESALYLDGLEAFEPVHAAWVGWMPACGKSVDTSKRLAIKHDAMGLWISVGSEAPVFIGQSDFDYINLVRFATGEVQVSTSAGVVHTIPAGVLPDQLRMVGEVQGGGSSNVVVSKVWWM